MQHYAIVLGSGRESSARSWIAFGPGGAQRPQNPTPLAHPVPSAPLKSIVIVDDEKSYTDLLTQMLSENLDCPVHAFSRPVDALQALPQMDPGVIVTDYHMPQCDGIEFIRQASTVAPQAAFVMITGHNLAHQQDQLDGLKALKAFLPKPFGWRKLADEILRVWPDAAAAPGRRADATSF
jgi:two-component SAPR family response regulator